MKDLRPKSDTKNKAFQKVITFTQAPYSILMLPQHCLDEFSELRFVQVPLQIQGFRFRAVEKVALPLLGDR